MKAFRGYVCLGSHLVSAKVLVIGGHILDQCESLQVLFV